MNGEVAVELLIVAFLVLFIIAVTPWEKFRRRPHYVSEWSGDHAVCVCGYSHVNDWKLDLHLEETK